MGKPRLGSGKRFANFTRNLVAKGYSPASASAIVASAGRKKYGGVNMSKMAKAGKARKERLMLHQKVARGLKP